MPPDELPKPAPAHLRRVARPVMHGCLTRRREKTRPDADQSVQSKTRTLCRPRLLAVPPTRVSMPPRRSARLVELANPHFQLPFPPNVVALLFSLLPLDARLRAREACRGWRFFLEDASFWTRVDMGACCGVNPRFLTSKQLAPALLRAACVRAKGDLQSVDLSGADGGALNLVNAVDVLQWAEALSAASKASLRDLVAPSLSVDKVSALCCALPQCRVRCSVEYEEVDVEELLPLLRREPPFALLTLCGLEFTGCNVEDDEGVLELASALAGHKGMEKLHIFDVPLTSRAVVDALVDAAISAGIKDAHFSTCEFSQAALPALTRLTSRPALNISAWRRGVTSRKWR